jgi:molybdopterin synthase catalytic subunit
MRINVRLFAGLRELVGEREVSLELEDGATVSVMNDRLVKQYPAVARYLPTLVCAVDEEYVPNEYRLRDGDLVALIPPVSGGAAVAFGPFRVTDEALDPSEILQYIRMDSSGAVVLFHGVARDHSDGRRVVALEYDAYPSMAERKLREVAEEIAGRFDITGIGMLHRTGRLSIGEASLLIGVSAAHRAEAFEACHQAVDRIKQAVPIWKKEVWEDGDGEWVAGHAVDAGLAAPQSTR